MTTCAHNFESPTRVAGRCSRSRAGFTVLEITVALGILSVAMIVVAELGMLGLRERARGACRQEAVETAANILESARAFSWESLTPEWAAAQKLPELSSHRLIDAKLTVSVEVVPSRPYLKRVTVEIREVHEGSSSAPAAHLVAHFSARSASTSGGKP